MNPSRLDGSRKPSECIGVVSRVSAGDDLLTNPTELSTGEVVAPSLLAFWAEQAGIDLQPQVTTCDSFADGIVS